MNVCIVEDNSFKNFYPLTKTRPVFGLRCGRYTIEERILNILGPRVEHVHYIMRPELEAFWKTRNQASCCVNFDLPDKEGALFLNGRVLFDKDSLETILKKMEANQSFVIRDGNCWISLYLHDRIPDFTSDDLMSCKSDFTGIENQEYSDHALISYPWDLIRYNSAMIRKDFTFIKNDLKKLPVPPLPEQVAVLKTRNLIIGSYSEVQPFVTLDAREGPIIIGNHVRIESGSYIKGPVSIGDDCLISANTKLYGNTTLGETCKAGGEISHSIIHGFSNKKHSGFLGNSYLGEWVNIGAGTQNSNLKNNYNTISVQLNGELVDTNSQFIGLFMGDHSRTAVGTQFNTASFVGVGCNIFGGGMTPRYVNDFSWAVNSEADIYDFPKFVNNARRMMIRREIELSIENIELLSRIYKSRLEAKKDENIFLSKKAGNGKKDIQGV